MGLRADVAGVGYDLLVALVPILSGGAVLCQGCTRHYILFMEPYLEASGVLSQFVTPGIGKWNPDENRYKCPIESDTSLLPYVPCFEQCGKASMHTSLLIRCIANLTDGKRCHDPAYPGLATEAKALLAFQDIVRTVVHHKKLPFPLTAILSMHHNLVSESVVDSTIDDETGTITYYNFPKKTYFSPLQACRSLQRSVIFADDLDVQRYLCDATDIGNEFPGSHLLSSNNIFI
jgi:hypothetical protein